MIIPKNTKATTIEFSLKRLAKTSTYSKPPKQIKANVKATEKVELQTPNL